MRQHRIFSTTRLSPGDQVPLDKNAQRHLVRSLRLGEGDHFVLFDGSGNDYAATLGPQRDKTTYAQVGECLSSEAIAELSITLAMGISRGERMDFSIQKAVELGVTTLIPLFTERTQVKLKGDRLQSRHEHWQGVIRHACEQSGRSRLPALCKAETFGGWLHQQNGYGLLLDHRATHPLSGLAKPAGPITLLVGPEGGLTETERQQALQQGFSGVRMGPRILRTETAPLAALAAIQTLWGDFRL